MNKFDMSNEKENAEIYSIDFKRESIHSIYKGYLVKNNEMKGKVLGYVNRYDKYGVHEYLIEGKLYNNMRNLDLNFISVDKRTLNWEMEFSKVDGKYISENKYVLNLNQIEYNTKKIDNTKRKVLNYEYDLGIK